MRSRHAHDANDMGGEERFMLGLRAPPYPQFRACLLPPTRVLFTIQESPPLTALRDRRVDSVPHRCTVTSQVPITLLTMRINAPAPQIHLGSPPLLLLAPLGSCTLQRRGTNRVERDLANALVGGGRVGVEVLVGRSMGGWKVEVGNGRN
ncbi:hypothetical protein FA13DRAFT_788382 [Coprinellus micaceus]|uniref:Uncharacterized protein n=1 Tax=Coprinellus micaceus TaxID=71717 RepID=A0A4Y7S6Z2_COPMI|nr:hypothetical protein FA13DRAFT_788382 [Coprinellus micaceus]